MHLNTEKLSVWEFTKNVGGGGGGGELYNIHALNL